MNEWMNEDNEYNVIITYFKLTTFDSKLFIKCKS